VSRRRRAPIPARRCKRGRMSATPCASPDKRARGRYPRARAVREPQGAASSSACSAAAIASANAASSVFPRASCAYALTRSGRRLGFEDGHRPHELPGARVAVLRSTLDSALGSAPLHSPPRGDAAPVLLERRPGSRCVPAAALPQPSARAAHSFGVIRGVSSSARAKHASALSTSMGSARSPRGQDSGARPTPAPRVRLSPAARASSSAWVQWYARTSLRSSTRSPAAPRSSSRHPGAERPARSRDLGVADVTHQSARSHTPAPLHRAAPGRPDQLLRPAHGGPARPRGIAIPHAASAPAQKTLPITRRPGAGPLRSAESVSRRRAIRPVASRGGAPRRASP